MKLIPQIAQSLYGYMIPRMKLVANSRNLKALVLDFFLIIKTRDKVIQLTQDAVSMCGLYDAKAGYWIGVSDGTYDKVNQTPAAESINGEIYAAKALIVRQSMDFGPQSVSNVRFAANAFGVGRVVYTPQKYWGASRLTAEIPPPPALNTIGVDYASIGEQVLLTITNWPSPAYDNYQYKNYVHLQLFDVSPDLTVAQTRLIPVEPLIALYPALTPRGFVNSLIATDFAPGFSTPNAYYTYKDIRTDFVGVAGQIYSSDELRIKPVNGFTARVQFFVRYPVGPVPGTTVCVLIVSHAQAKKAELAVLDVYNEFIALGYTTLTGTFQLLVTPQLLNPLDETTAIYRAYFTITATKGTDRIVFLCVDFMMSVVNGVITLTKKLRVLYERDVSVVPAQLVTIPAQASYTNGSAITTVQWLDFLIPSALTKEAVFVILKDSVVGGAARNEIVVSGYSYLSVERDAIALASTITDNSIAAPLYTYNGGNPPTGTHLIRLAEYKVNGSDVVTDYNHTDPVTSLGLHFKITVYQAFNILSYSGDNTAARKVAQYNADKVELSIISASTGTNPYADVDYKRELLSFFAQLPATTTAGTQNIYTPISHGEDGYILFYHAEYSHAAGSSLVTESVIKSDAVINIGQVTVTVVEGVGFIHPAGADYGGHTPPPIDANIGATLVGISPRNLYFVARNSVKFTLNVADDGTGTGHFTTQYDTTITGRSLRSLDKNGAVGVVLDSVIVQEYSGVFAITTPSEDIIIVYTARGNGGSSVIDVEIHGNAGLIAAYSTDTAATTEYYVDYTVPCYDAKNNKIIAAGRSVKYGLVGATYMWQLTAGIEHVRENTVNGLVQGISQRWDFSTYALNQRMTHTLEKLWVAELEAATGHKFVTA